MVFKVASFLPLVGSVVALDEGFYDIQQGNYGSGALNVGLGIGGAILDCSGAGAELHAGAGLTEHGASDLVDGEVEHVGSNCLTDGCFVAGTPVEMADGSTEPIQDVKPGQRVLTRDQYGNERSQVSAGTVTETYRHRESGTVLLSFADGGSVQSTAGHPFYVSGRGFTPARDLKPGDKIAEAGSGVDTVKSIVRIPGVREVYNLDVAGDHTYFVIAGHDPLWVHNSCGDEPVNRSVEGPFSVRDWSGYPEGEAPPTGPFTLRDGDVYAGALDEKDAANRAIHAADPALNGLHIHENHPVKFGGSPTDPLNKRAMTPAQHYLYNAFWRRLQYWLTGR